MSYVWEEDGEVRHCAVLAGNINNLPYIEVDEVPPGKYRSAWVIDWDTGALSLDPIKVITLDVEVEEVWVREYMILASEEIEKFSDGHTRTVGTNVATWRKYRNDLRDHVQDGIIKGVRPESPTGW